MQKTSFVLQLPHTSFAAACLFNLGAHTALAQRPEDKPLPPPPPVHAEFKFDFGPGKARAEDVKVLANEVYTSERGYGFDFGSQVVG